MFLLFDLLCHSYFLLFWCITAAAILYSVLPGCAWVLCLHLPRHRHPRFHSHCLLTVSQVSCSCIVTHYGIVSYIADCKSQRIIAVAHDSFTTKEAPCLPNDAHQYFRLRRSGIHQYTYVTIHFLGIETFWVGPPCVLSSNINCSFKQYLAMSNQLISIQQYHLCGLTKKVANSFHLF